MSDQDDVLSQVESIRRIKLAPDEALWIKIKDELPGLSQEATDRARRSFADAVGVDTQRIVFSQGVEDIVAVSADDAEDGELPHGPRGTAA